jgi:ABC-2 type transport system ATP-binding protein
MIGATNLTKKYGNKTAVDNLTFIVRPRVVTGFLGPNGSGKSTTMRMLLRRSTTRTVAERPDGPASSTPRLLTIG